MSGENTKFISEYHGFDDDYKAEMLRMRLSFSRANFEHVRFKFAMQLRNNASVA